MNKFFAILRETSFGLFFIPFGIVMMIMGYFFFQSVERTKDFIRTPATVSRMELFREAYYDGDTHHDAEYTLYVTYTVDGQEYDEEYGVYSGYQVGDTLTIVYNPADPRDIAQPINIVVPICMEIGGVASLIAGVVSLVRAWKKRQKMQEQEKGWQHEQ